MMKRGLQYKGEKTLNFLRSEDGDKYICEVCKERRLLINIHTLRRHLMEYHRIHWEKYVAYVEVKDQQQEAKNTLLSLQTMSQQFRDRFIGKAKCLYRMKGKYKEATAPEHKGDVRESPVYPRKCSICGEFVNIDILEHMHEVHKHVFNQSTTHTCTSDKMNYGSGKEKSISKYYKSNMESLLVSKDESNAFSCIICGKMDIRRWPGLREHVINIHSLSWCEYLEVITMENTKSQKILIAQILDRSRTQRKPVVKLEELRDLKMQKQQQRKIKPFCCQICKKVCVSGIGLMKHLKSFHKTLTDEEDLLLGIDDQIYQKKLQGKLFNEKNEFICVYCARKRLGFTIISHMRRCHKSETDYKASLFRAAQDYRRAKRRVMVNPHKSACSFCGKVYKNAQLRQRHALYGCRDNPQRKVARCGYCNYTSSSEEAMQSHIKRVHDPDKPYQCEQCGKVLRRRNALYMHRELVHPTAETRKKFVSCPFPHCGKTFRFPFQLRPHMQRHQGVQKHQCPECSRCFCMKADLSAHVRKIHQSKSRVCEFWGKKLVTKAELRKHPCYQTPTIITGESSHADLASQCLPVDNVQCKEPNQKQIPDHTVNVNEIIPIQTVCDTVLQLCSESAGQSEMIITLHIESGDDHLTAEQDMENCIIVVVQEEVIATE